MVFQKQKGSALLTVIVISGFAMALIGAYLQSTRAIFELENLEKKRQVRDELARDLLIQISNPEVIKEASQSNKKLKTCLEPKGSEECQVETIDLLLPSIKKPDQGYNFDGELGKLGPCYPLEPRVYAKPVCPQDAKSCPVPESIQVAYQIKHKAFPKPCPDKKNQSPDLGSYPKELQFVTIPTHTLKDYECNEGAFAMGYDGSGSITCRCQFPYVPTGKSNVQGVLCKKKSEDCPSGSLLLGKQEDGDPICKEISQVARTFRQSMELATENTKGSVKGGDISCGENGWLGDLKISCKGTQKPVEEKAKGHSCLFLYTMAKYIDGKYMIPGMIPEAFFPTDEPKGCYARRETFAMKGMTTYWDGVCYAAITGLLFTGMVGALKGVFKKAAFPKGVITKVMNPLYKGVTEGAGVALEGADDLAEAASEAAAKTGAKDEALGSAGGASGAKGVLDGAIAGLKNAGNIPKDALVSLKNKATVASKKTAAQMATVKTTVEAKTREIVDAAASAAGSVKEGIQKSSAGSVALSHLRSATNAAKASAPGQAFTSLTKDAKVLKQTLTELKVTAKKTAKETGSRVDAFRTLEPEAFRRWEALVWTTQAFTTLGTRLWMKRTVQELAKEDRKNDVVAEEEADKYNPAVEFLFGGLTPPIIGQAIAFEIVMEAYSMMAASLRNIPFVGPAIFVALVLAGGFIFTSWQVRVDYSCYPVKSPPELVCQLSGLCYDIDNSKF
jgi:hypothetical protein